MSIGHCNESDLKHLDLEMKISKSSNQHTTFFLLLLSRLLKHTLATNLRFYTLSTEESSAVKKLGVALKKIIWANNRTWMSVENLSSSHQLKCVTRRQCVVQNYLTSAWKISFKRAWHFWKLEPVLFLTQK